MSDTAHFFWQGQLTPWELAALESFRRNGWKVKLWSYDHHDVAGVESADAESILPRNGQSAYRYQGFETNPAAWSEFFRIKLLIEEGGWWFDTDCICLRNVGEFQEAAKNRPYVLGFENEDRKEVNNAVQQFNDINLASEMLEYLESVADSQNGNFPSWGELGFKHITGFLNEKKMLDFALPARKFYPVDSTDSAVKSMLDPRCADVSILSDSLVLHYWNFMISRAGIDKRKTMPPVGSILDLAMKGQI